MNKRQFDDLRFGDILEICVEGINYKKQGFVMAIDKERVTDVTKQKGSVFILPFDCDFRNLSSRFGNGYYELFRNEIRKVK